MEGKYPEALALSPQIMKNMRGDGIVRSLCWGRCVVPKHYSFESMTTMPRVTSNASEGEKWPTLEQRVRCKQCFIRCVSYEWTIYATRSLGLFMSLSSQIPTDANANARIGQRAFWKETCPFKPNSSSSRSQRNSQNAHRPSAHGNIHHLQTLDRKAHVKGRSMNCACA